MLCNISRSMWFVWNNTQELFLITQQTGLTDINIRKGFLWDTSHSAQSLLLLIFITGLYVCIPYTLLTKREIT